MKIKTNRLSLIILVLSGITGLAIYSTQTLSASCTVSPCDRGFTWRDGGCKSGNAPGYEAHMIPRCPAGYTLNRRRGVCQKPGCVDCEKPACSRGETYRNGSCHSRPRPFTGVRSHRIATCEAGWRLIRSRGTCRRINCPTVRPRPFPVPLPRPIPLLRPDLTVTELSAMNYGRYCNAIRPVTVFRVRVLNRGAGIPYSVGRQVVLKVYDRHYPAWNARIVLGGISRGQTKIYYLRLPYLRIAPAHMSNTLPHPFIAVVDSTRRVRESNESNNNSRIRLLGKPAACR